MKTELKTIQEQEGRAAGFLQDGYEDAGMQDEKVLKMSYATWFPQ